VGYLLSVDEDKWSGEPFPTITFQWERCDQFGTRSVAIPGATSNTYVPQAGGIVTKLAPIGGGDDDVGSTLRAVVTARNPSGVATEVTKTTAVVSESDKPPDPTE
jgi:hypothetical protein